MITYLALIAEEMTAFFAGIATKAGKWITRNYQAIRSQLRQAQFDKQINFNFRAVCLGCNRCTACWFR